MDDALEPVAQFEEIPGRRAEDYSGRPVSYHRGRHMAAFVGGGVEFGDLGTVGSRTTATTAMSRRPEGFDGQDGGLVVLDGGYAWTVSNWDRECRLLRHSRSGTLLSDVSMPSCWHDLSPDGSLFAVWTFESAVSSSPYGA